MMSRVGDYAIVDVTHTTSFILQNVTKFGPTPSAEYRKSSSKPPLSNTPPPPLSGEES